MMDMGASKKLITYNRGSVLDIGKKRPIAPANLMKRLGYSTHEAHEILSELKDNGLVEEYGPKLVKGPGWTITERGELRNLSIGRTEMAYTVTEKGKRENRSVLESIFG